MLGIAGDPVRHDKQSCQQNFCRRSQARQLCRVVVAAIFQRCLKQLIPAAFPKCLFSLGVVVACPAHQLSFHFFLLLRLAVVGPRNGGDSWRTLQLYQNRFARPGVRCFLPILLRAGQGGKALHSLPCLWQQRHQDTLKGNNALTKIMCPAQKACQRDQGFFVQVGCFLHAFRQPLPHQQFHDLCRIPQMHPERQPEARVIRIGFARQKPCVGQFHAAPPVRPVCVIFRDRYSIVLVL